MVEERGVVIAIEGQLALLETQPKSACSHCNVGNDGGSSCGTSVLAKWFGNKRNRIQVNNHLDLQQGDIAVIGISNEMLVMSAFMVYLLPLISMILASAAISSSGGGNVLVAVGSLLGLLVGLLTLRWVTRFTNPGAVTLVRKESANNYIPVEIDITRRGKIYE